MYMFMYVYYYGTEETVVIVVCLLPQINIILKLF